MSATGRIKPVCPPSEQLAQFIDGQLGSAAKLVIQQHLLECSDCRGVVVEASIALEKSSESQRTSRSVLAFPFPSRLRWPTLKVATAWTGAAGALAVTVLMMSSHVEKFVAPIQTGSISGGPSNAAVVATSPPPVQTSLPPGTLSAPLNDGQAAANRAGTIQDNGRLRTLTTFTAPPLPAFRGSEEMQRFFAENELRATCGWSAFRIAYDRQGVRLVDGWLAGFPYAQALGEATATVKEDGVSVPIPQRNRPDSQSGQGLASAKLSAIKMEDVAQSNPACRGFAATALLATGDATRALVLFEQLKQLGVMSADFLNDLSVAYLASGRVADALASAEAAIRFNPKLSEPYFNRAVALEKLGRDSSTAWDEVISQTIHNNQDLRWRLEARRHLAQQIQTSSVRK